MPQIFFGRIMIASVLLGLLGVSGTLIINRPSVDMHIEPTVGTYRSGETFVTKIVVTANEPVNVFYGDMRFDSNLLEIVSIDYNTSIADLWAQLPWYSNGDGTLNFTGGTTQPGGFMGNGELITITFRAKTIGSAKIVMKEVRVLKHDGLGTDASVAEPIDSIFTIDESIIAQETRLQKSVTGPKITILSELPKTDLNGDGKQTIADVSIFMQHLVTQNKQSDFNQDGKVNTADLSIILDAK